MSAQHAETLRKIARDFERGEQLSYYSCNAVRMELWHVVDAYAEVFELYPAVNAKELWSLEPEECNELRVLMLCFAAAMAETGDL